MGLRVRRGLPRGGIGYLGVPIALGAVLVAFHAPPPSSLWISSCSNPLCLYLGLGLRADGEAGEATDRLTWESPGRFPDFDGSGHSVAEFRLSSAIVAVSLSSPAIALYRVHFPG